jgi:hypothetical protein
MLLLSYTKFTILSMARKQTFIVKLTEEEKLKLVHYAKFKGVSMSELIQDYCKNLPSLELVETK